MRNIGALLQVITFNFHLLKKVNVLPELCAHATAGYEDANTRTQTKYNTYLLVVLYYGCAAEMIPGSGPKSCPPLGVV